MASHGAPSNPSSDELDADEPRTPLWLPLLGLCLFVVALVYVLTRPEKPAAGTEAAASAAPSAGAPPTPAPAPPH